MGTARNPALFVSPVDWNFYGYRIVNNDTAKTAQNVTVGFKYRGYEVALTSHNPLGSKVIVLLNKVLVDEYGTVEAAISAIDERLLLNTGTWQTGRNAAMRHTGRH